METSGRSRYQKRRDAQPSRRRLRNLLGQLRRSRQLVWVAPSQCIVFPSRVYIFRPDGKSERIAKRTFDAGMGECVAVRVGAVASIEAVTFASVWPIARLADGEAMFIRDSVKIDAPHDDPPVIVVRLRVYWWLLGKLHRRWRRRRDALLGIG